MTAREEILGDVGRALGRTAWDKASIAAEARTLLETPDAIRPSLPTPSAVESFLQRVVGPKVGATVDRVASLAGLPGAVARFLAEKKLDAKVALQPTASFTSLDWARAGVMLHNEINEGVVVGLARWGIAETGSLVFHSAADTPILFNFLPAVNIVAVHAHTIVPHMEDYATAACAVGSAPRNACLITGASGTTDIEGSLVKGAHGPRDLHIVLVDDAATAGSLEPGT